jgi:predicted transcriptional regulator of viral defense system
MMAKRRRKLIPASKVLRDLGRPVFTTREFASLRGTSPSSATQTLDRLAGSGQIVRASRGLWCDPAEPSFSAFALVPFLIPRSRGYLSFYTALHLHGIIEQIPQVIQVATMGHRRRVTTPIGVFEFHRIDPRIFDGFDWLGDRQDVLVASPEKALVDCLYLSTRRGRRFGSFPEMAYPRSFSSRRARRWAKKIPDPRIRAKVLQKLKKMIRSR